MMVQGHWDSSLISEWEHERKEISQDLCKNTALQNYTYHPPSPWGSISVFCFVRVSHPSLSPLGSVSVFWFVMISSFYHTCKKLVWIPDKYIREWQWVWFREWQKNQIQRFFNFSWNDITALKESFCCNSKRLFSWSKKVYFLII